MGKSDMNIPVYFTKPKEQVKNDSEMSFAGIAESISTTIKGIGKSVLNIAGQGDEEKVINQQEAAANVVLLSSEIQIPLAVDAKRDSKQFSVRSIDTDTGRIGIPQRCRSELRLSDLAQRSNHEYEVFDERSNIAGTLMNPGNVRLPQRRLSMPQLDSLGYRHTGAYSDYETESHVFAPRKSCLKNSDYLMASTMSEQLPMMEEQMVIGDLTQQIERMSREVREDFGHGGEPGYVEEDYDLTIEDEEAMDYTTWRIRQIKKAEREAQRNQTQSSMAEEYLTGLEEHGIESTPIYEDYTNPYQYTNGSCLTGRSQSTYFPAHDWSEDYEKENRYKQQPPSSPLNSHYAAQSMPSLIDHNHAGYYNHTGYYQSKVDNRTKPPEDKSVIGKLFSREKPDQNKNLDVQGEPEDSSLVGFLKTRVGGILGPTEAGSSWFK
ncbi:hypothetical protein QZH41_005293 [Actinostola sp. cb2023]|nr:hypothetical protein QZH41_005293 [Actinostola sp. cb2023]